MRCSMSPLMCNVGIVHQVEARLASKRAARAEAREIRMRELERQQQEVGAIKVKLHLFHLRCQHHLRAGNTIFFLNVPLL